MGYYLRLWMEGLKLDLKSRLQYRADMFLATVVSLLSYGLNFIFFLLVFRQIHSVEGVDWGEMLVLVGTAQLVMSLYSFIGGKAQDEVYSRVLDGSWDRLKTRPVGEVFMVLAGSPDTASAVSVAYSASLVAAGVFKTGASFSLLPFYLLGLAASLLTYSSVTALICAMTFRFVRVPAFAAALGSLAGYAVLPRAVYKGAAMIIFCFLFPVGVWGNMPSELLMKGNFWWQGFAAASVFFMLSVVLLRSAASSYESAGG